MQIPHTKLVRIVYFHCMFTGDVSRMEAMRVENSQPRDGKGLMMSSSGNAKRTRVRPGRPPKELAGDVEGRILDAAEKLFLEKAFKVPASTRLPN